MMKAVKKMFKIQLVGGLIIVVTLIYGVTTTMVNPVESNYVVYNGEAEETEEIEMKIGHDERWMSSTIWGKHKEFVQTINEHPYKKVYTFHIKCIDNQTELVNQAIVLDGKVLEIKERVEVFAYDNVCFYADDKIYDWSELNANN